MGSGRMENGDPSVVFGHNDHFIHEPGNQYVWIFVNNLQKTSSEFIEQQKFHVKYQVPSERTIQETLCRSIEI